MEIFFLFSILITATAIFSYFNVRFFKLPSNIVLLMMGTIVSLLIIIAGKTFPVFSNMVQSGLSQIDFSEFLLGILLSFLLFAGSLHIKLDDLKDSAKSILGFSIVGTLLSTTMVGLLFYYCLNLFQIEIPLTICFVFGALISPTDPIAVIGILSQSKLSQKIKINIIGESLFNDGIGVVLFAVLLKLNAIGLENLSWDSILIFFLQEAVGGIVMGIIIGSIAYFLMKKIDHFQTEILISLAAVMGGYSLCHYLHVSGPLAMVMAGLIIGNHAKKNAMSSNTLDYLEKFWEVLDEVLNALLFMLIGLELMLIELNYYHFLIGLIIAVILLPSRYISLWVPIKLFRIKDITNNQLKVMTWGGLRGGISMALALSLPPGEFKEIIITITFVVLLFSILVQGLSIPKIILKLK